MKATLLLTTLESYLQPLVDEEGGVFSIAAEPQEALEMLAGNAPKRWRLVLVWGGYTTIDPDDGADGFADNALKLYLQMPGSMSNKPAGELHRDSETAPAMVARIELVILWIRRLRLNLPGVDCRQIRFAGGEWEIETKSGKPLHRTHRCDFLVTTELDEAAEPFLFPPEEP